MHFHVWVRQICSSSKNLHAFCTEIDEAWWGLQGPLRIWMDGKTELGNTVISA